MAVIGRPAPPSKLSSSDIADNAIGTAHIQANVITHADLAPNSVTSSEMADDAVGIAELSASGTPNATSFLRGDNSWQVVDTEGTGIKSTGESGGTKFLREDGDGTSSWQTAGSPSITDNGNATALTIGADEGLTINGSLQQLTNRNLTGTYSSHELFIADGFTLTGNITVNEDIVLTKLSDDGTSITLTTDGNSQTITGSGSLEASTIAQTPVTSVTGMTGTVGNSVTFPAGHIIKTVYSTRASEQSVTSGGGSTNTAYSIANNPTFLSKTVTPTAASSSFLIQFNSRFINKMGATGWNNFGEWYLTDGTNRIAVGRAGMDQQAATVGAFNDWDNATLLAIHEPNTTSNVTYSVKFYTDQYYSKTFTLGYGNSPSFLIIQEIAG